MIVSVLNQHCHTALQRHFCDGPQNPGGQLEPFVSGSHDTFYLSILEHADHSTQLLQRALAHEAG